MKTLRLFIFALAVYFLFSCSAIQGSKENYGIANLGTNNSNNSYVVATKKYENHDVADGLNVSIFRVDHDSLTRETTLYATVKDNLGNHIFNMASPFAPERDKLWKKLIEIDESDTLTVDNFVVEEIRDTSAMPFKASFILDYSGSMRNDIGNLEKAFYSGINLLREVDECSVVQFDQRQMVTISKLSKNNIGNAKLTGISNYGGYTSVYDAAMLGIENLKSISLKDIQNLKKKNDVLVIFTDGGDNSSVNSANEVLRAALENNIKIYVIGYAASPVKILEQLALTTGGNYYFPQSSSEFESIFKEILLSMNVYYKINYTSPHNRPGDRVAELTFFNETNDSNIVANRFYTNSPNSIVINDEPISVLAYFDTDNANIDLDKYGNNFQDVVNYLNDYTNVKVKISGHTDSKATRDYNLKLSKKRAEEAKNIMVKMGLDASRIIEVDGFAFDKRIYENDESDKFKMSKNRRVQVEFIK